MDVLNAMRPLILAFSADVPAIKLENINGSIINFNARINISPGYEIKAMVSSLKSHERKIVPIVYIYVTER